MGSSLVRLYQEKFEIQLKMSELQNAIQYERNKANSGILPNKGNIEYLQTCLNAYTHLYKAIMESIRERRKPTLPVVVIPTRKEYVLESVVVRQV